MKNYLVFCESVRGSSHAKKDVLNQDFCIGKRTSHHITLAVSDGHGATPHIRSHIGARYATKVLEDIFSRLTTNYPNYYSINDKTKLTLSLKKEIINSWRKLILDHFKDNKLKTFEKELIKYEEYKNQEPFIYYGTTLLGVHLMLDYMVVVQIGDGNIVALLENNKLMEYITKNEELIANQTTSLCDAHAVESLNVVIIKNEIKPVLIALTTDGVINSFTDSKDFYQIPYEIIDEIKHTDFKTTCDNLKELLMDMTIKGSGDDCTISLLYDSNYK